MLEALDLAAKLSKARYTAQKSRLQRRLHRLQRACWEGKLATVVLFEGWDAAGKGTAIAKLTQRLEPRGYSLHATRRPRTSESHMPWLWRFWCKLPNWGEIGIFDRSWYGRVLVERVEGLADKRRLEQDYDDIVCFERTLADDRYLIVKFFLHISKDEQEQRFRKLEEDQSSSWRVEPEDWERHAKYDEYHAAIEQMLAQTEGEWAPWTLVEATDRRWARIKIFETMIRAMEEGLVRFGCEVPAEEPETETDDADATGAGPGSTTTRAD